MIETLVAFLIGVIVGGGIGLVGCAIQRNLTSRKKSKKLLQQGWQLPREQETTSVKPFMYRMYFEERPITVERVSLDPLKDRKETDEYEDVRKLSPFGYYVMALAFGLALVVLLIILLHALGS